jgi:hypothetical protein
MGNARVPFMGRPYAGHRAALGVPAARAGAEDPSRALLLAGRQ